MAEARRALEAMDATEVAAALRDGTTTSVEVVSTLLARIATIDAPGTTTELRSVLATAGDALAQAEALDAERASGTVRSALHGVPVVVKDNIEAVGLPGSAGSTALHGRPVAADAPLVARLRDAGMVVMAATNLSEWANFRSTRSTSGWSAVGGLTVNPYCLDRSAGGSSSGSGAALAARLAPLAVGTETDGSITCPASLNGVVGLKPAVGAVPTERVVPIAASQDSPGPMARTVADVAALFEVLAARPGVVARTAAGAAGVRVGVAAALATAHPGTDEAFAAATAALERAGATLVDVEVTKSTPEVDEDELMVLCAEVVDDLSSYLASRPGPGPASLAAVIAHELAHRDVELAHFGHELFEMAEATGGRAGDRYAGARAHNLAWALDGQLEPAMAVADCYVAPAYGPAWKNDLTLGGHPGAVSGVTTAPSIAGWPIATVPMGITDGLPVGLAIVGRPGDEARLLAVAAAVEAQLALGDALVPRYCAPQRA